jgi:hypothetical protein
MLHHRHSSGALLGHSYAPFVRRPSATQQIAHRPLVRPQAQALCRRMQRRTCMPPSPTPRICICPAFLRTALHPGALGKLGWISLPCRRRYWVSSLSVAGFAILNHPLAGLVAPVSPILFQSGVAGAPLASRTSTCSTIFLLTVRQRKNDSICNFLKRQHSGISVTVVSPVVVRTLYDDGAQQFEQLKLAIKNVGFSKRHVAQACQ